MTGVEQEFSLICDAERRQQKFVVWSYERDYDYKSKNELHRTTQRKGNNGLSKYLRKSREAEHVIESGLNNAQDFRRHFPCRLLVLILTVRRLPIIFKLNVQPKALLPVRRVAKWAEARKLRRLKLMPLGCNGSDVRNPVD